jgi:hypothetical protein
VPKQRAFMSDRVEHIEGKAAIDFELWQARRPSSGHHRLDADAAPLASICTPLPPLRPSPLAASEEGAGAAAAGAEPAEADEPDL